MSDQNNRERCRSYEGIWPNLGDDVFIAEGAKVIGQVHLGDEVNVWYNAVIRGDVEPIRIGPRTNIQDLTMIHVTDGEHSTEIGADVTVGHRATLHGCTVDDESLIGMAATLLDGVHVEEHCLIGAGALLTPGTHVPAGSVALGSPAEVVRDVTAEEREEFEDSALHYADLADKHRDA
jgi:carbonic anhydrase/acetyltransferase-like protein (isoleucine patch superfamily)